MRSIITLALALTLSASTQAAIYGDWLTGKISVHGDVAVTARVETKNENGARLSIICTAIQKRLGWALNVRLPSDGDFRSFYDVDAGSQWVMSKIGWDGTENPLAFNGAVGAPEWFWVWMESQNRRLDAIRLRFLAEDGTARVEEFSTDGIKDAYLWADDACRDAWLKISRGLK